jgi:WD40 repeat protein
MPAHRIILTACLTIFLCSCMATPTVNIQSGDAAMELKRSVPSVQSIAFSRDGMYALSGAYDGSVRLWDLSVGKGIGSVKSFTGYAGGGVLSVAFWPEKQFALAGGGNGVLKLLDIRSEKEVRTFKDGMNGGVFSLAISSDGRQVLSGGNDGVLRLWDIASGSVIQRMRGGPVGGLWGRISTVDISHDGKFAISAGFDNTIRIWDIATGKEVQAIRGKFGLAGVLSVTISKDGKYILAGGNDNKIRLFDVNAGRFLWVVSAGSGFEGIRAVAFSPDGKYGLSGGHDGILRLWDLTAGRELKSFKGHSSSTLGGIVSVAFSPNDRYIMSGGWDGSVRIWDMSTGEEVAMLIGFNDGEWLVITHEGYYNSSEKGAQYLTVKSGDKDFAVEQFYDVFYRPDIVAAKLRGENIKGLITITMQDAIKSPPPFVEFTTAPPDTDKSKVKVCYQAKNSGGGIGEVRLFHNGKLIQSDGYYRDMAKTSSEKQQIIAMNSKAIYENMRSVSIKGKTEDSSIMTKSKGEVFNDCREIEAVSGENEVSVTAFNGSNTVQGTMKTVKFSSAIKHEDPHLYILSIGIDTYKDSSVTLKYAAKDATDIEQKLLKQSITVYKPQNIHYELLIDSNAGKSNIINKIGELARVIKPSDGFIFFVAGHGVLLQNQYYMLTNDYNGTVNEGSMISSNEIVEMSKKIKSLSQLFIFDTCHAGGVDTIVSGLYDARMSVLAKKMGLHIYASANSLQEAQDGYQGNGLFTYTLLDGLNNKKEADKNNDNTISLMELGVYSKQATTEISKKIGHLQTPLIINFGKDSPIYSLK